MADKRQVNTLQMFERLFDGLGRGQPAELAPAELHTMIKHVPNLDGYDQQLLLAYLYEATAGGSGTLTFREFEEAFTKPAWTRAFP